jgi:hypothetical protein
MGKGKSAGQRDLGCWEGNKEAHTIHFLKNCTLKTRTSSDIILEWTNQQFNQLFYDFICTYQFFDKDDKKTLIVTTDTFSLTKFLMENFDSDNGPLNMYVF